MKKSSKSNSNLFLNLIASVGLILLVLPMFLAIYTRVEEIGSLTNQTGYTIFTDWSTIETIYQIAGQEFNSACALIVDIMAVALLVVAAIYVIMFVLQFTKMGKNNMFAKINKFLSIIALLLTVVALICGIIFFATSGIVATSFIPGIGFYMLIIGGVVLGLLGYLANRKA